MEFKLLSKVVGQDFFKKTTLHCKRWNSEVMIEVWMLPKQLSEKFACSQFERPHLERQMEN